MAYNQKFYKTESATAHSLTSCAAGTRGVGAYTASAESIISQRDTDRKALVWAQAAAQSLVTCRYDPFSSVSGLSVLPLEGLDSSGEEGGPFSPATIQYTIFNFGNEDCNWQCNASESWVTVSATSGFLYAGESVIIQIGLGAAALPVGTHTATLTFYNASKSIVATTRQVVLEVTAVPVACFFTMPTLLIDGDETPYADLSAAQTALSAFAHGCIGQFTPFDGPGRSRGTYVASQDGTTKVVSMGDDLFGAVPSAAFSFSFSLGGAGNLSIGYDVALTLSDSGVFVVELYQADQTTLQDSDSASLGASGGSGTLAVTVPDSSVYYLKISYTATASGGETDNTLVVSADVTPPAGVLGLCAVRAAWDDGGGVNYVACT